jgi:hypothetical protein
MLDHFEQLSWPTAAAASAAARPPAGAVVDLAAQMRAIWR